MKAVVMHDFFADHYFTDISTDDLLTVTRQGGSIKAPYHKELGGYAASLADGLGMLGVDTSFIARVDEATKDYLKDRLPYVDLSLVKTDGIPGFSIVVEHGNGDKVNLMLDALDDSNSSFGPEDLDGKDYLALSKADVACIANWGINREGTRLLGTIARYMKDTGGYTFFDAGDVSNRKFSELRKLIDMIGMTGVDYWAMNEFEARQFAYSIENEFSNDNAINTPYNYESRLMYLGLSLQNRLPDTRILIHSADYVWVGGTMVSTYDVPVNRVTGAGDTWNAGFVYSMLNKDNIENAVGFANACAGYLVKEGRRPTLSEAQWFESTTPLKGTNMEWLVYDVMNKVGEIRV